MLHFSSASHNAFEPTPPRGRTDFGVSDAEHRLLRFANGTGGGTGAPATPPEPSEPNQPSEAGEAKETTDTHQAPRAVQTETRTEAQHALEGQSQTEGQVNTADTVLQGIEALKKRLLTTQQKAQQLYQTHKDIMPGKMQNQVLKADAFLSMQLTNVERWIETVHTIQTFRSGSISPTKLAEWLTTYIANTGEKGPEQDRWKGTAKTLVDRIENRKGRNPLTTLAIDKMDGGDKWQTQNASTQTEIDQEIQAIIKETEEIVPVDDLLALIDTNRRTLQEQVIQDGLQKMDDALKGMEENLTKVQQDKKITSEKKQGFLESIGLKFYSALEIWEAFKMLKEAYIESYRQRTRLNASGLAQSAGNVVKLFPFAGDIQQVLDSQLEEANEKIKNGYMSFLKGRYVSFRGLFDPGGELDRNRHDINRARAVLEYAASRGWLWDIDESSESSMTVAGQSLSQFLPKHWNQQQQTQYFQLLQTQNRSGQGKEKEDGKNQASTAEDISVIIPKIIEKMQDRNFWYAFGMAEAAMVKGKVGEVSPWLAATFFNEMRKSDTMKYFPKSLIDQLGGLGLGHPGFTLQTFKLERHPNARFNTTGWNTWRSQKQNNIDAPIERVSNFSRAFHMIEHDLADVPEEQRMRLIAKVLAGQVVEYDGKKFSIFSSKYKFYRDPMIKQVYEAEFDAKKADHDFFGEESEVILYGPKAIADLLTISNQKFVNTTKATNTLRNILDRYDQLIKADLLEDAKEYQHDMRRKFHAYLRQGTINDTRTEAIAEVTVTPKTTDKEEHAFAGLVKRGLIEQKELENLIKEHNAGKKHGGINTFKNILRQIDPNHELLRGGGGGGGGGAS
ncbi:hypothetical protein HYZ98_03745 [Candidatus Peregrinibacteria bacterium]|nr:hypothetical protein [Candidatus Peregrinibacteria bacterium]